MKVFPHWWHDEGYWEFDADSWKEDAVEMELPDELVERYKAVREAEMKIAAEIGKVLTAAGYTQGTQWSW